MYKNAPKLIFEIDLMCNSNIRIKLLHIDKHCSKKNNNFRFFSSDLFIIKKVNFFSILKSKHLYLPIDFNMCDKTVSFVYFDNDSDRYQFLKKLKNALLEWSISKDWDGFNPPDSVTINYLDNFWMLF